MSRADPDLAIFAKAPIPGYAKTRLISSFGATAAARLQRELTLRALHTACTVGVDRVTLWCAPDAGHRFFRALARCGGVACRPQPEGDLGRRMASVFAGHGGPLILIGSDCPALTAAHLDEAASALRDEQDAVFVPAEDGGYALIGLRRPAPALFEGIEWGSAAVMAQTRERLRAMDANWRELETLWDVDRSEDVARWQALCRECA